MAIIFMLFVALLLWLIVVAIRLYQIRKIVDKYKKEIGEMNKQVEYSKLCRDKTSNNQFLDALLFEVCSLGI